ncbi:hypothetical protein FRX31_013465 [Thalictrum thalictroides]|uniref:Uncharacterized protein n=1 Tax=Thalictrum thalictroides TaxID=46969 RepID=A0A7J6WJ19_THATH|nr:hypothetical protein FRX31_013465 [Thalictrum thalictroides]
MLIEAFSPPFNLCQGSFYLYIPTLKKTVFHYSGCASLVYIQHFTKSDFDAPSVVKEVLIGLFGLDDSYFLVPRLIGSQ